MHHFVGCLEWGGRKHPLDSGNVLLRGCRVRNTDTCYGMVIYAGTATGLCGGRWGLRSHGQEVPGQARRSQQAPSLRLEKGVSCAGGRTWGRLEGKGAASRWTGAGVSGRKPCRFRHQDHEELRQDPSEENQDRPSDEQAGDAGEGPLPWAPGRGREGEGTPLLCGPRSLIPGQACGPESSCEVTVK